MGLREAKKLQTRQEIAGKAMGLFARRGFDHVTVAEVAEAAAVSEKTVFNYFPTKEDLFWDEVPEREAAMVEAVRNRRPGESVAAALERLQAGSSERLSTPGFATFARIIEESRALQAKELEIMARYTDALSAVIAEELGVRELDARVAANVLVSAPGFAFATRSVAARIASLFVASPFVLKTTTFGGRTPIPKVCRVRWLVS